VIRYLKTHDLDIRRGILQCGPFFIKFNEEDQERVGVGSVYELGNGSFSLINLHPNLGPLYGNLRVLGSTPDCMISNLATSLIPGLYPRISGPFSNESTTYDRETILSTIHDIPNLYLTKMLGFGKGHRAIFSQLAEPNISGLSMLAQNVLQLIILELGEEEGVVPQSEFLKLSNYSTIYPEFVYPLTVTGTPDYLTRFDSWFDSFGITKIYGTNDFPTFGWAGSRLGASFLGSIQAQRDTQVNYPAAFLQYSKSYEKIGILFAGQGVQYVSSTANVKISSEDDDSSGGTLCVVPYQQGRGVYDYYSCETQLGKFTESVLLVETIPLLTIQTTFGPEGIQPGRNNAFLGVALTNYFSGTLNLKNQAFSSTTPQDTRKLIIEAKPPVSVQATNAPLVYIAPTNASQNVVDPLPWNSLNAYVSSTTTSARNQLASKVPIMQDGVTTMCISGAYPLYRGSHATEYSGFYTKDTSFTGHKIFPEYLSHYLSQYYLTEQYWDPNFDVQDTLNSKLQDLDIPVSPNPPFYIKGARVVLYEGQRVLAGSYVYASMNMVGNVTMSQFLAASGKEIKYVQGQNTNLLQDPYGKYQGNQGGLLVIVQTDGQDPLMVPDCCQPVGVVLETIEGIGTPTMDDSNQLQYTRQTLHSTGQQLVPDFENTFQLQSRQIKVRIFPMFGNLALSGYSNLCFRTYFDTSCDLRTGQPFTNSSFFQPVLFTDETSTTTAPCGAIYQKIRTLYTLHDSPFSFITTNNRHISPDTLLRQIINYPYPYNETGIRGKQFMNDYYGPESKFERPLVYNNA